MSFLDEQATGQIGIGEKANLSTLTRRKRKRKKGQAPTGSETYSLMPQNEFSNIVSSPTDIQQVGIGNLLQAQGSSAGEVPNVFEQYDSAAPVLGTKEAVYYQPPEEEEEEEEEDLPSVEDDPMRDFSPDTGVNDPESPNFQGFATTITHADGTTSILAPGATGQTVKQDTSDVWENMQKLIQGEIPDTAMARAAEEAADRNPGYGGSIGRGMYENENATFFDRGEIDIPSGSTSLAPPAAAPPSVGTFGYSDSSGGDPGVAPSAMGDPTGGFGNYDFMASGGTVKAKNKNSFMSMKGK